MENCTNDTICRVEEAVYAEKGKEVLDDHSQSKLYECIRKFCFSKDDADERPFYVMDFEDIERKCETMEQELPGVTPFYAVKCNTDSVLLALLVEKGFSFDCASKAEMKMILDMGVSPERIILANTHKQIADVMFASKMGVDLMTFDSQGELFKIKRYAPNAKVVIRIKEPSDLVGKPKVQCKLGDKSGCRLEDAAELIDTCVRLDLQLIGVSFHVGSCCQEPLMWRHAIAQSKQLFHQAEARGYKMTLLDIGGGVPGTEDEKPVILQIFQTIRECLQQHFPPSSGVRVISEPGTFYTKSAFTLVARIISKKIEELPTQQVVPNISQLYKHDIASIDTTNEKLDVTAYVLSVGLFTSLLSHAIYDEYHRPMFLKCPIKETCHPSVMWGPSCDSFDRIVEGFMILPELAEGDWVYFTDVGNYSSACASNFNGTGLPYTIYVANGCIIDAGKFAQA